MCTFALETTVASNEVENTDLCVKCSTLECIVRNFVCKPQETCIRIFKEACSMIKKKNLEMTQMSISSRLDR